MTDHDLAARLLPSIRAALEASRPEIEASVGPLQRFEIERMWPHILDMLPALTERLLAGGRQAVGTMTLGEAFAWLGRER